MKQGDGIGTDRVRTMIVKCECGGNVNTDAKQCPHCGKPGPFHAPPPPPPKTWPQWVLAVVLSIVGLALVLLLK